MILKKVVFLQFEIAEQEPEMRPKISQPSESSLYKLYPMQRIKEKTIQSGTGLWLYETIN